MTFNRIYFQMRATCLALLHILFAVKLASSFVLETPRYVLMYKDQESSIWPLHGKFSGGDDFCGIGEINKARTDIRNFLTQRALQSFTFLLSHCRDTATVRWLEVSLCRSNKMMPILNLFHMVRCTSRRYLIIVFISSTDEI